MIRNWLCYSWLDAADKLVRVAVVDCRCCVAHWRQCAAVNKLVNHWRFSLMFVDANHGWWWGWIEILYRYVFFVFLTATNENLPGECSSAQNGSISKMDCFSLMIIAGRGPCKYLHILSHHSHMNRIWIANNDPHNAIHRGRARKRGWSHGRIRSCTKMVYPKICRFS